MKYFHKTITVCLSLILAACNATVAIQDGYQKLNISNEISVYPIDMNTWDGQIQLPTAYDFSLVQFLEQPNKLICNFIIRRRPFHDQRLDTMATGRIQVLNGRVTFLEHLWHTKGMADSSYLKNDANIAVTRDWMLVGKMPYFHLFVDPGEVARPPIIIVLSKKRTLFKDNPLEAQFLFEVDAWQEGLFDIKWCK